MLRGFILFFLFSGVIISGKAQQADKFLKDLHSQLQKSNKDSSRVNLLLQLSEYYFSKSPRQAADLDSSLSYVRTAETLSNSLGYQKGLGNSYAQYSKIFHTSNDTSRGKYFAGQAVEIFKKNRFYMELGYAYFDLSGYYSLNGSDLTERIRIVEQLSLPAFRQSGSILKEADILKELADLQQIKGDYSEAISNLRNALQLYQSISYPFLHGVYDLLGTIYEQVGDYDAALKYSLLAVQSIEKAKDTSLQLCTIYNRAGVISYRLLQYTIAEEYFLKSITVAIKYKDTASILIVTPNVINTYLALKKRKQAVGFLKSIEPAFKDASVNDRVSLKGSYIAIYMAFEQFQNALPYVRELLGMSSQAKDPVTQKSLYRYVLRYHVATNQYSEIYKYVPIYEKLCKTHISITGQADAQLWWFKADSSFGKYLSAIKHFQQYKVLRDSVFNETKNKQRAQLQIQYEIGKKDQDIVIKQNNILLLTKQAELQQSQLKQTRLVKNLTLGGIALLLIIVGLLYNLSKQRLRSQKKLEAQQEVINQKNVSLEHLVKEKDWLVKEIHHRVKNNFHIVMGLLGTQSGYLKSEEAIKAMSESQHRVHAMSLIHQKLYQSDNLSAINMAGYIHELVDYLRDSFNIRQSIQFNLQIDPIELGLSHCIPVGLIINEAITNSIKYAFPDNRDGRINISFKQSSARHALLVIHDTGVGLPPAFYAKNITDSMGMRLMQGLSDDIDGKFSIRDNNGTEIILDFVYDPDITIPITQVNTELTNSV